MNTRKKVLYMFELLVKDVNDTVFNISTQKKNSSYVCYTLFNWCAHYLDGKYSANYKTFSSEKIMHNEDSGRQLRDCRANREKQRSALIFECKVIICGQWHECH